MKFILSMLTCLCIVMPGIGMTTPTQFSGRFHHTPYRVCFTPGGPCTQEIVEVIDSAKHRLYIQAYGFTSAPIAKAVIAAKRRGVKIVVLLDKSNVTSQYSIATTLSHYHIPFMIDYHPAIAHNKVMIIDAGTPNATVITGSFNFTRSAQKRNAENLLIIHDKVLASIYLANFEKRQRVSESLKRYCHTGHHCKKFSS